MGILRTGLDGGKEVSYAFAPPCGAGNLEKCGGKEASRGNAPLRGAGSRLKSGGDEAGCEFAPPRGASKQKTLNITHCNHEKSALH